MVIFAARIKFSWRGINPLPVSSPLQRRLMTREELRSNREDMWQALSSEQSTTLLLAVEMLLRCHLSPYQILAKTLTALEGSQQDS